jgi:molybdate transport system ATP-binding protein
MLDAKLVSRLGDFALDVAFEVPAGATLVVVGESGAGKTTLLRLLAGLLRPDDGHIRLGGDTWSERAGTWRPPHTRPVGWVPQDYALFPHLSALDNVAFGVRAAGASRPAARERAHAALARVDAAGLAARRPAQLSGGEQQRVALARALALEPRLLLLDEPLAALDPRTRASVRAGLRRLLAQASCTTVLVTHSPTDAMVFGDRIAVLEAGRITQTGSGEDLLRRPRSGYVAEFLGLNLYRGVVTERGEGALARVAIGALELAAVGGGAAGEVWVVVAPRDVTLSREAPHGSARNLVRGRIAELVPEPPFGERLRVSLDSVLPLVAEITPEAARALALAPGEEVVASFKATAVTVFE